MSETARGVIAVGWDGQRVVYQVIEDDRLGET